MGGPRPELIQQLRQELTQQLRQELTPEITKGLQEKLGALASFGSLEFTLIGTISTKIVTKYEKSLPKVVVDLAPVILALAISSVTLWFGADIIPPVIIGGVNKLIAVVGERVLSSGMLIGWLGAIGVVYHYKEDARAKAIEEFDLKVLKKAAELAKVTKALHDIQQEAEDVNKKEDNINSNLTTKFLVLNAAENNAEKGTKERVEQARMEETAVGRQDTPGKEDSREDGIAGILSLLRTIPDNLSIIEEQVNIGGDTLPSPPV